MPHLHPTTRLHEIAKAHKALLAGQSVAAEDPFQEPTPEHHSDPMILPGAWPGEEPLDELPALLVERVAAVTGERRCKTTTNPQRFGVFATRVPSVNKT